jgi:hypothetical protein
MSRRGAYIWQQVVSIRFFAAEVRMHINLKIPNWAPTLRQQRACLLVLLLVTMGGVSVSLLPHSRAMGVILPVLLCVLLSNTLLFLLRWLEGFLVSMAGLLTVLTLAVLVSI